MSAGPMQMRLRLVVLSALLAGPVAAEPAGCPALADTLQAVTGYRVTAPVAGPESGWCVFDRAVLRVAVWELLHADDVPEPVAVDEAVELAKALSTDESPGFVNGVLGQIMLVTPQIRAAAAAVSQQTPEPNTA